MPTGIVAAIMQKGVAVLRETWGKSQCLSRFLGVKRASDERLSIELYSACEKRPLLFRRSLSNVALGADLFGLCERRGVLRAACAVSAIKGMYRAVIRARLMVWLFEKGVVVGRGLLCQRKFIA